MGTKTGNARLIARDGDKASVTITFTDSGGNAYDVSGWSSWTLTLRKFAGGDAVLTTTSAITAASSSSITIVFDSTTGDYANLAARPYRYELDATIPGDTLPTTILAGEWNKLEKGADPIAFSDSTTIEV